MSKLKWRQMPAVSKQRKDDSRGSKEKYLNL
jgi:hypothetical protein